MQSIAVPATLAHGRRGPEDPCTRGRRSRRFAPPFVRGSGRAGVAFFPRPLTVFPDHAPYTESRKTDKGLPDFGRPLYGLSR